MILTLLELCGINIYEAIYETLGLKEKPLDVDCEMSVHYINVGQGDCSLIISGDDTVLIDCGEKKSADDVSAYLDSLDITKIDYLIATHPHSDHIGSMAYIVENYDIGKVIAPKLPSDLVPASNCYIDFLTAIDDKGLTITPAVAGDEYILDGKSVLKILGPVEFDNELNNASVICRVVHGETSFLFTGDAEKSAEQRLVQSGANLQSDVIKVGHHGSSHSSCDDLLEKVCPSIAVISVGADNSYGHPGDDVIERLSDYTQYIYRTDINGNIVIGSDGSELKILCSEKN